MRKMLRRGAMLALALILLLSHTMGALAINPKEPSVIVDSYGLLYTEIAEAQSGDVIGIRGTIIIPSGITLDAGYRDIELRRMEIGAKLVFAGDSDYSIETKINSFIFNGNAPNVGGNDVFVEVNGTAIFDGCTFYDCYNGEGGNEGGSGDEQDPTTPPEDTEGDDPTDPTNPEEGGDPPTEGGSDAPDPSTPSKPEQGGSGGSTDNSQTDNSTTDNSDHSTTDNSESASSSTVDNSSRVSNTDNSSVDNSSSRSESSKTENSNNTTTYNYYTAEDKGFQAAPVAPQGGSQPVTVNVSVPQADQPQRAAQEPVEAPATQDQRVEQNIHIEGEGIDLVYDYSESGVSISISSSKGSESPTEAVEAMAVSSSTLPSGTPTEAPRGSGSWVDYATLILLAVLVVGELRDKFNKKA